MFIPTRDCVIDMSATEFEKYSLYILNQQIRGLENVRFEHDALIERNDGTYQIDGVIRFTVMGLEYTTLVECKHYRSPISREKIQVLYDKIRAIGAHKGIFVSTSNFQSGAIKYATEHGIALIQITEADTQFQARGRFHVIQAHPNLYNRGLPYIGVMLVAGEVGISCQFLREYSYPLREFLEAKQ